MFNTIILLLVVLIIFSKLKSILGTRPEGTLSKEEASKLFDFIMKETEKQNQNVIDIEASPVEEDMSPSDKNLAKIPNFNKEHFINGSKRAFEIITSAFSKGDIETLEMLVHKNLIKKFQEIIEKRKNDGISSETDLISFETAEITDAKISKSNVAKIAVKFITEQVNILKNSKNETIEGDENFIQKITDIWTFERSITSTNPTWLLVSTKK